MKHSSGGSRNICARSYVAGHLLAVAELHSPCTILIVNDRPSNRQFLMTLLSYSGPQRRLHAEPELAATPVIFYTATYSESEAMRLAASCGVATAPLKPTDPARILAAVDQALRDGELRVRISRRNP